MQTIEKLKGIFCNLYNTKEDIVSLKKKNTRSLYVKSMFCFYVRQNDILKAAEAAKIVNLSGVSCYEAIKRHPRLYKLSKEYRDIYDRFVFEASKIIKKGKMIVIVSPEGEDIIFYNTSPKKTISESDLENIANNVLQLKQKLN